MLSNLELKPNQLEGIDLLINSKSKGLNYSTGLGKTIIELEATKRLMVNGDIEYAILCHIKSGKKSIEDDNDKFFGFNFNVVNDTGKLLPKPYINLIQYNALAKLLPKIISTIKFNKTLLVLDEISVIKSFKTSVRKAFDNIRPHCDFVWGLTATPLANRIQDIYSLTNFIEPNYFGPYYSFLDQFCHTRLRKFTKKIKVNGRLKSKQFRFKEITGYKNLKELNRMVCRVWDIQRELMEIRYKYINLGPLSDEEGEEYLQAAKGIVEDTNNIRDFVNRLPSLQLVSDLSETKQGRVRKFLTLLHKNGVGCLVFFPLKKPLRKLMDSLDFSVEVLTGDTSLDERSRIKDEFTSKTILFCTSAGSKSFNFHLVNKVIFYTVPFEIETFGQMIGRAARPFVSTFSHIEVYLPFVEGTIDKYRIELMKSNSDLVNKVLGGTDPNLPKAASALKRKSIIKLRKELLWKIRN